jgi:hypothetical protein
MGVVSVGDLGASQQSTVNLMLQELFFPMFLGVSLDGLFAVMSGVSCVRPRCVGMVCGLLMMSAFVMLSRFAVMAGSVCVMFRCLLVVFRSFL